ncbi:MAG TPA: type III polyketide synthase [Actinomycetes bacterium]|nr:type III polyketide synthase [Actinomycetes bacterium]
MTARVQALGTAMPERVYKQDDIVESFFGAMPGWEPEWAEVFEASGVERRASVVDVHHFFADRPTTAERMRAFVPAARRLGAHAAKRALDRVGPGAADEVGDLIVVSCTGYAGPGLDVHLAADLGLSLRVRRLALGHMGCHAALPALRTASALVNTTGQRSLVVCVELCTLHMLPPTNRQEAVSAALFGDGAAAALLGPQTGGPAIVGARTATLPDSEDRMGWLIGDHGFHMSLSPRVPAMVDRTVSGLVRELLHPHDLGLAEVDHWVVHPGGPEILERVQRRLGLSDAQLAPSREALVDGGNRSSATVLFILESLAASAELRPGQWLVVLAFGTGLTMEALLLRA